MTYIVDDDLIAEFGNAEVMQLQARDGDAIDSAIAWAERTAEGYLKVASLTVPTPTPDDLRGVLCDMVRWRLYDDALTDVVTLRYQAAMDWLKGVANGRIVPDWVAPVTGGSCGIAYTEPTAIFTVMPSW